MKLQTCILSLALLALAGCGVRSPTISDTPVTPIAPGITGSGGINAPDQLDKPYLILVSIDGFRWDYQDTYATPALDRLAARGVRAESVTPVFPTLTFPNHYSIATGLFPANHGLVGNRFPSQTRDEWYDYKNSATVRDGSWYGGEPIWVAAEKSGMVSAAFFFVGTEAGIGGVAPTYTKKFDSSVPGANRVAQVLDWLAMPATLRPHMITLYFEHVDSATHRHGVGSGESIARIAEVDGYLGTLLDGIEKLPFADNVYVIVVSDHGQSNYEADADVLVLDEFLDLDGIAVVEGGAYAYLFFDAPDAVRAGKIRDEINRVWRQGRAWLPDETPQSWHVSANSRFADVIVQPDPHHAVVSRVARLTGIRGGNHGWDPTFRDMHGIFVAAGPRLPRGTRLGTIDNLDVYPLLLEILELPRENPVDGDPDRLTRLLR